MHEEPFTTRSVENLVEIVKNFNDTTGSIFSTACERRKERKKRVLHRSVGALSQLFVQQEIRAVAVVVYHLVYGGSAVRFPKRITKS